MNLVVFFFFPIIFIIIGIILLIYTLQKTARQKAERLRRLELKRNDLNAFEKLAETRRVPSSAGSL
ncbi:MAG TPA: hypothetical protein ENH81_05555 [Thermococcus sp.]|nr:hypothetical protein [Thermococcus sp.]